MIKTEEGTTRNESPARSISEEKADLSENEKNFRRENYWRCCGKITDRRIFYISIQIMITFITLCFAMVMVFLDPAGSTVWISLISTIAGNYLPNSIHNQFTQDK